MRTLTSMFSILALTLALGCGDDGGDDGNTTPDANTGGTADAMTAQPDAMPQGGTNLGAICNQGTPCDSAFPSCLSLPNAQNGFCSNQCGTGVTVTTNAQGQVPIPQDPALHAMCAAGYTGVGTPACSVIIGGNLPNPPMQPAPDTEYMVDLACGVACEQGTNACPAGLTCTQGLCAP